MAFFLQLFKNGLMSSFKINEGNSQIFELPVIILFFKSHNPVSIRFNISYRKCGDRNFNRYTQYNLTCICIIMFSYFLRMTVNIKKKPIKTFKEIIKKALTIPYMHSKNDINDL